MVASLVIKLNSPAFDVIVPYFLGGLVATLHVLLASHTFAAEFAALSHALQEPGV